MDLSTIAKKLKNLQYVSKIDFQKDLDLIWSNCLTFNALPDSIYRVHATKMKERATNLLKKIPDIYIRNAADLSDSEDDSKAVELTPTSEMEVQSLQPVIELNGGQSPSSCQDTQPSGKEEEEYSPLDEQLELQQQLMYDNDYLVRLWKTKTFNQRVVTLKDRSEQFLQPFAERKCIRRSEAGFKYYNQQEKLNLKRNCIRSELLFGNHIENEDLDIFDHYNLPELSIMASYPSSPYVPHESGDLASFFLDDDISPFIPPAPPQSLSEYQQYNIDTSSPLNQGILN
jgi:hypothetical protein